jgi:hypothetical protein
MRFVTRGRHVIICSYIETFISYNIFPSPVQLINSHPSSSQHVSTIYGHHQVSSISLKLLHSIVCQKHFIACESDIS